MKCDNCGNETRRIKVFIDGSSICPNCSYISEAGGTKTDGLLTRNRFSIRQQAVKYEGDTIPPHIYDKSRRKVVPNQEWINRNADNARNFLTSKEIKESGNPKLNDYLTKKTIKDHQEGKDIEYCGSAEKKQCKLINELKKRKD